MTSKPNIPGVRKRPVKSAEITSPPILPPFIYCHYLKEAVDVAHDKNPDIQLTPEAIVHYAAGGLFGLELLTYAPSPEHVLLIDKCNENNGLINYVNGIPSNNPPNLLALSKEDCIQIGSPKKEIYQSDFKTGYRIINGMLRPTHTADVSDEGRWVWRIIGDNSPPLRTEDNTEGTYFNHSVARNRMETTTASVPLDPPIERVGINNQGKFIN